jgi:hypothetical protein
VHWNNRHRAVFAGESEQERTGFHAGVSSTSWGSLVRAQYRPLIKALETASFFLSQKKRTVMMSRCWKALGKCGGRRLRIS